MRLANQRGNIVAALVLTLSGLVASALQSEARQQVSAPPHRAGPDPTTAIAFSEVPIDNGAPRTSYVDPSGGAVARPTLPGQGSLYPRLSPDGRWLVAGIFTDQRLEAAVMHPDGSHFKWVPLTGLAGEELDVAPCSWLAERVLLCSVRTLTGAIDGIYRIDITSRQAPVRLTRNPYPRQESFGGGDQIADISPNGARMVFTRARPIPPPDNPDADQSGALFVAGIDGSHLHRITPWGLPNSHDNGMESWGDQGRAIVFGTEDGQLATITPDGSRVELLDLDILTGSYAFAPTWEPHGTRIAFGLYPAPDYQPDLYTADLETGQLHQLTDTPETDDLPNWGVLARTPLKPRTGRFRSVGQDIAVDGHLFFTKTTADDAQTIYSATGHHERQLTAPGDYCCVLRASKTNGRILVFPTADQSPPLAGGTLDLHGQDFRRLTPRDPTLNLIPTAWSPDGTRIAYLGWDETDPSRRGLYTSRADGRDLTRVTTRAGNLDDVPLDYSPDGHRLLFYRSAHPDPDPHTDGALWVVNVDGTRAHPITTALTPPADWARWSPDGRRIVFANERTSPTGALWTVDPSGSHLRRVYAGSANRFPISPVWSHDGHRIVFGLDPNNDPFTHPDNEIWSMSDDGDRPRLVDDTPDFKSQFDWLP